MHDCAGDDYARASLPASVPTNPTTVASNTLHRLRDGLVVPPPFPFEPVSRPDDFRYDHDSLLESAYPPPTFVMSTKTGRNAPCPCGSGKKYKKCCLPAHDAARSRPPDNPVVIWDDDDLDELSNSVVDLIHNGKLDEAERACDELDRRFPDMIDCLERRGMLLEARGESKLAASYYRRAAEFARSRADDFDTEFIESFTASADRLDPPSGPAGR